MIPSRVILAVALATWGLTGPAQATNLLLNPGFEDISGQPEWHDQGALPNHWFTATPIAPGADTYSSDDSFGLGLPNGYGHFQEISAAHGGLRFVAGSGVFDEDIGQTLTLLPGQSYEVSGWAILNTGSLPDSISILLRDADGVETDALVATWATLDSSTQWLFRSATFVAPAGSAAYEWVVFDNESGYNGLDDVSLVAVPEPSRVAAGLAVLALVATGWRRRSARSRA